MIAQLTQSHAYVNTNLALLNGLHIYLNITEIEVGCFMCVFVNKNLHSQKCKMNKFDLALLHACTLYALMSEY